MTGADPQLTDFPADFIWGAATAAYQIEGAVTEGGRGPSIWDTFSHEPGRIIDGSTGDVACDHYHRYQADVDLMAELGLTGYRFSFAWPRIQPTGSGPVNREGMAFYDRLIDALLARDIRPMGTLFHWDLPQALQDQGGWANRETAERFAEYAGLLGHRFADRVSHWMPVNEPNVFTFLGHAVGQHAPGLTLGLESLPVAHHLLLGHGRAVQALRAAGAAQVGTATNHTPVWAASQRAADVEAAAAWDDLWNRLFADPILLGRYPDRYAAVLAASDADLRTIAEPIDFYGVNYYNPVRVGAAGADRPADPPLDHALGISRLPIDEYEHTDFGWPVVPAGLHELLLQLHTRYAGSLPPIIITENGCSYGTEPDAGGRVRDEGRIAYYDGHLRAVRQAIGDGVAVSGYCAWSILDNFEWAEGFGQRFGLVHVDYGSQQRIPKDSFYWYRDLIRANRNR
ncbi:MAG TPA: GH1 family beta-glucosidase [Jatrophihabitans sp.]|nr:GH1 family beta-glucosidase [Jatrophihabitans sp.]